jgi:membrane-associated phospholipid phosphatase
MLPASWTSAWLSALFLLVYGTTNWLATLRSDLPTWYFRWELAIPFVPLFIVPYMSIDLFFVAAPFVCSNREQRAVLARRIVFAILVAGAIFVLMPLRLAYPREPVEGWLGAIFDAFRGFDAPHNLFPSLHIALQTILADTYARNTRGPVRVLCLAWFGLIALSTVLTYQHHVVDIAGGFVLGVFALHLFPIAAPCLRVMPNHRIGVYYLAGALALLALAWPLRPWGAFLPWPAGALAMVAAGYFGIGPGIFRKHAGRLPFSTRFALAPVLVGQYLSLVYYRRRCRPWDEAAPGVWIGRQLSPREAAEALRQGVTAVLDLTGEFSEVASFRRASRRQPDVDAADTSGSRLDARQNLHYSNLPILDLTAPTQQQLCDGVAFIEKEAHRGIAYVHCKIGYSRSAAVVGAYLIASGAATCALEAIATLRRARPSIIVRPEAQRALEVFAARHGPPAQHNRVA